MKYFWALVVFLIGEILSLVIFSSLKKQLGPQKDSEAIKGSTLRGILERLTVYIGLLYHFPQIIIAFAALKKDRGQVIYSPSIIIPIDTVFLFCPKEMKSETINSNKTKINQHLLKFIQTSFLALYGYEK